MNGINLVPGSGLGLARAGAFTTPITLVVNRTRGLALQNSGGDRVIPVTVSGSIFPADRGVLALIHWPSTDTVGAFLAQAPLEKVVAAIVLGSGLSDGGGCITKDSIPPMTCDGSPGAGKTTIDSGSIFSVGVDASANYDPFAYPGQATGQYDLHEINTGISDYTGEALPGFWGTAWKRTIDDTVPGAGQVRWGTDPTVDTFDPTAFTPYGIPVLGAGLAAYTAPPGTPITVVNPGVGAHTYRDTIGSSFIVNTNFFRFRLPYLKDYSRATGLKYTPHGLDAFTTRETRRYFIPQTPAAVAPDYESDPTRMITENATVFLTQAGNYDDFAEDHWNWQLGRYRHSFYIPGSDTAGPGRKGSYWLIHFKREADFESFVIRGHMPWAASPDGYEVYGALPVDTSAINSGNNLVNASLDLLGAPGTGPANLGYGYGSKSYHVLRSSICVADNTTMPVAGTKTFAWILAASPAAVVFISGVAYFVPLKANGAWNFKLNSMHLGVADAWKDFYRTDDNALLYNNANTPPARLSSPCPMFMGIAPFAYETLLTIGSHIPPTLFGTLAVRSQRLEVPFPFLGAFSDATGPVNADDLTVTSLGTGVTFPGDVNNPSFSGDATLRAFVRRPLPPVQVIQPVSGASEGDGVLLDPVGAVAGAKILFHSTRWNLADPTAGHYGNFLVGGVAPAPISPALATATKDVEERFLDETYRYLHNDLGVEPAYVSLVGPGMAGWFFGPIPTPVRIGLANPNFVSPFGADIVWQGKSFAQVGKFLVTLEIVNDELQVAGIPSRNPAFVSGALVPFPSAGVLLHPQTNYTTGLYVPDNTAPGGGLAVVQPDYSGLLAATRSFVRCFDAAFARGSSPTLYDPGVQNQPFVVFRIDGLKLEDFRYVAPGWGGLGDGVTGATYTGIAIMVKVPGLTTWMDLGRLDGTGPSKQDGALDGAGCLVIGPNTFDSIDATTGMVYCQVRVNVGPAINLAGGQDGGGHPEVPVMVKVVMNNLAQDYNLKQQYTGFPGQFNGADHAGYAPRDVRGLCGIKVVYPALVETVPVP